MSDPVVEYPDTEASVPHKPKPTEDKVIPIGGAYPFTITPPRPTGDDDTKESK